MRKFLVPSVLVLALAAGIASHATTTTVVVSTGNQYVPGDNDYGAEAGAPGLVGLRVTHLRGNQLQFVNADIAPHSFTSVQLVSGVPRFGVTTLQQPGETIDVRGIASLGNGSYPFRCTLHAFMKGTLVVTTA